MKVAVIIGHTKYRKGAFSKFINQSEWDFNSQVAKELGDRVDVYTHASYSRGYTSMIRFTADKINRKDYDLVLELHFNAATPQANGAEALYYFKNKKAKKLAAEFTKKINQKFGIKDRGAKALYSENQRGFSAVYYPRATTLILEPFFGSNYSDCKKINVCTYAAYLKQFINEI